MACACANVVYHSPKNEFVYVYTLAVMFFHSYLLFREFQQKRVYTRKFLIISFFHSLSHSLSLFSFFSFSIAFCTVNSDGKKREKNVYIYVDFFSTESSTHRHRDTHISVVQDCHIANIVIVIIPQSSSPNKIYYKANRKYSRPANKHQHTHTHAVFEIEK